jgi:Diacylglycerol kinase accessory domain
MWGKNRKPFRRPTMSDGLLEVVGIKGTFHMAKIQSGGSAKKIGQVLPFSSISLS